MGVFEDIKAKLEDAGVEYKTTHHGSNPEDSDESMGYPAAERPHFAGAKAIVIKGRKTGTFYHFTLPDPLRLDQKKVKAIIGERWSFASGEEVEEVTGCIPGSVPPFGSCIGLKTHMDKNLAKNGEIFFNAGSLTDSIKLKLEDFVRVEQPEEVDVAQDYE